MVTCSVLYPGHLQLWCPGSGNSNTPGTSVNSPAVLGCAVVVFQVRIDGKGHLTVDGIEILLQGALAAAPYFSDKGKAPPLLILVVRSFSIQVDEDLCGHLLLLAQLLGWQWWPGVQAGLDVRIVHVQ